MGTEKTKVRAALALSPFSLLALGPPHLRLRLLLFQAGKGPKGLFWALTTSSPHPSLSPKILFVTYFQASGQEQQDLASESSALENQKGGIRGDNTRVPPPLPTSFTPNPFSALALRHYYYLGQQPWNIGVLTSWELWALLGDRGEEEQSHDAQGSMHSGWECVQRQRSCFFRRLEIR